MSMLFAANCLPPRHRCARSAPSQAHSAGVNRAKASDVIGWYSGGGVGADLAQRLLQDPRAHRRHPRGQGRNEAQGASVDHRRVMGAVVDVGHADTRPGMYSFAHRQRRLQRALSYIAPGSCLGTGRRGVVVVDAELGRDVRSGHRQVEKLRGQLEAQGLRPSAGPASQLRVIVTDAWVVR
ncbi:MAG: hypothetical protein ACRC2B_02755 [Rubrivivax sp.]